MLFTLFFCSPCCLWQVFEFYTFAINLARFALLNCGVRRRSGSGGEGGGVKGGPPSPPYYSMRKNYGKRENTIKSSKWQDWWKDICWNYVNLALSNKPGNPASKWIQQHYADRWISQ